MTSQIHVLCPQRFTLSELRSGRECRVSQGARSKQRKDSKQQQERAADSIRKHTRTVPLIFNLQKFPLNSVFLEQRRHEKLRHSVQTVGKRGFGRRRMLIVVRRAFVSGVGIRVSGASDPAGISSCVGVENRSKTPLIFICVVTQIWTIDWVSLPNTEQQTTNILILTKEFSFTSDQTVYWSTNTPIPL